MKHIHHLHIYHTTAVQSRGHFTLFSGFALVAEIEKKENRRLELNLAVAQSNVYQEEEKLQQQKRLLDAEQEKLVSGCQNLALEIRRETDRIHLLCDKIADWNEEKVLEPVQQAAESAKKAYTPFKTVGPELFAKPIALFERAQLDHRELPWRWPCGRYSLRQGDG